LAGPYPAIFMAHVLQDISMYFQRLSLTAGNSTPRERDMKRPREVIRSRRGSRQQRAWNLPSRAASSACTHYVGPRPDAWRHCCLAQVVRHQTRVSGLRDTNDTDSMTGDIPLKQRDRFVAALW